MSLNVRPFLRREVLFLGAQYEEISTREVIFWGSLLLERTPRAGTIYMRRNLEKHQLFFKKICVYVCMFPSHRFLFVITYLTPSTPSTSLFSSSRYPLSFPFLPHFHFSSSFSQTIYLSIRHLLCAFLRCVLTFYISIYLWSFFGREIFKMTACFKPIL